VTLGGPRPVGAALWPGRRRRAKVAAAQQNEHSMTFFGHLHAWLAYAGLVATLGWAAAILFGAGDVARFGAMYRRVYLAMAVLVGLSALAGLVATVIGPWWRMAFPWIGLAAIALHNILGARSRRALWAMRTGPVLVLALVQVVVLVLATGLMAVRPF